MEGKIIEAKLEKVESRLGKVDTKIGKLEKDLTEVKKNMATKDDICRLETAQAHFEDILGGFGGRLDRFETTQDRMLVMLVDHDTDIKDIKYRMEKIETKMEMFDVVIAGQDKIIAVLQKNDQEVTMTQPRFKRLEGRVDRIETHLQLKPVLG